MRVVVLTFALAVAACASTEVDWERVESPHYVADDGSFSLELPLGWLRSGPAISREGWNRQTITFNAGPVLSADEQAIDLYEPELLAAMQEQLAAQPGTELVECHAATLDGLAGFRMYLRQEAPVEGEAGQDGGAARTEVVIYGAIQGATLYAFMLESQAPESFALDLATFERVVASFKHLERMMPGP